MKKIIVVLWSIFLSCNVFAYEFNDKKEYFVKKKSILDVPKVMEFFSFFCPYCYEFKKMHNVQKLIKKNINIQTYHVNFLGGEFSHVLTKSWIIAQEIGIEEKIVLPIFKGIQDTYTINNLADVKKIFKKKAGISEKKFNSFWNSLTIQILVQKKNKYVKKSNLDHVPTMLVNGKYIIDYSKIENSFKDHFFEKYIKLIQFLINKK